MGRPEQVVTLHSAATADANGREIPCVGIGSIGVQITGTFVAVVYFEGTIDGTNWVSLWGTNVATGGSATSANAAGIWEVATGGIEKFRARLDWTSGTSITVTARENSTGVDIVPTVLGGAMLTISQTPTVSTTPAYTAGDAVGGLLTFASAARGVGRGGLVKKVVISDNGKQSVALDLVLYDTTITAPTDNAAFDPTDAENLTCVGHISIGAANYASLNDNSVATVESDLAYTCTGTSLFGALVTRGTPTYVATNDITVRITVLRE